MVTSIRTRKIARSTVRRVKRNKLSKNVKRFLKRKVSKRKVMKGGASHFEIYLVYFTETKGLLNCSKARFRMNVVGLLFYSKENGDSFYFGYDQFGYVDCDIFLNEKYKIFTPQYNELERLSYNSEKYRTGPILHEDLAFISWLCGLPVTDKLITKLETRINANGILKLRDNNVIYCVNLNKKLLTSKLELGYSVKKTKTEQTSDSVYDNETVTKTTFEITNVGNLEPKTPIKQLVEGEIEIKIDGADTFYFYLELQKQREEIPRGVSVVNAIIAAGKIMTDEINYEKNQLLDHYNTADATRKYNKRKDIINVLDECLTQIQQQPEQATPQPQPLQQATTTPPP